MNEAAIKYMGLKDPIGENINWGNNGIYKVIGIVKNMVMQSPYDPARPMIYFLNYSRISIATIKLNPLQNASSA